MITINYCIRQGAKSENHQGLKLKLNWEESQKIRKVIRQKHPGWVLVGYCLTGRYIGIVGSRRRDSSEDFKRVKFSFSNIYQEGDVIVSGGCKKGGDKFAELLADIYEVPIKIFKAEWNRYGRSAGFRRNTTIAKKSDILIACVAKDRKSGTEDTIKKFKKFHPKGKLYLC